MNKGTMIAIGVGVLVVLGFILWPNIFPPEPEINPVATQTVDTSGFENQVPQPIDTEGTFSQSIVNVKTDILDVEIDPNGAVVTSYLLRLTSQGPEAEPLQMVLQQETQKGAFELWWGGSERVTGMFDYQKVDDLTHQFSKRFVDLAGNAFTLTKTYQFRESDYMMEVLVGIRMDDPAVVPILSNNNFAYSLEFGPQMGPDYFQMGGNYEFRKFYYMLGNERKELSESGFVNKNVEWAGMIGRYFGALFVPDNIQYQYYYHYDATEKGLEKTWFDILRSNLQSSNARNSFKFYIGPRAPEYLEVYENPERNAWGLADTNLKEAVDTNPILGWLVNGFKWVLVQLFNLVGNWGVAIVLLSFLIKLLLFPLTNKFYQSTAAMQKIQPMIKEIQTKYKDDPNKMNAKMMELYQKEKVNPLGGCLPMLLQMPILFAMFDMFRNHFDLRGAEFVGWITDLSAPDTLFELPFEIPFLGWTAFRLLPFLMIGTQMLMTVMTQKTNPTAAANPQGKWMTYLLPLIFFFILYDMPSGLVIYWTINNLLTAGQQYWINTSKAKKTLTTGVKK